MNPLVLTLKQHEAISWPEAELFNSILNLDPLQDPELAKILREILISQEAEINSEAFQFLSSDKPKYNIPFLTKKILPTIAIEKAKEVIFLRRKAILEDAVIKHAINLHLPQYFLIQSIYLNIKHKTNLEGFQVNKAINIYNKYREQLFTAKNQAIKLPNQTDKNTQDSDTLTPQEEEMHKALVKELETFY